MSAAATVADSCALIRCRHGVTALLQAQACRDGDGPFFTGRCAGEKATFRIVTFRYCARQVYWLSAHNKNDLPMLFQHATSFLAISQLIFMACFYLVYYRRHRPGQMMMVYAVCLIGYIVGALPEVNEGPGWFDRLMSMLAITAPALLWIITHYLFVDDLRIGKGMWALFGCYISLRGIGIYTGPHADIAYLIYYVVPQLVMLGLAVHVIYTAMTGRGTDLVEPRRKLRVPFAASMGTIVAMIVASGFLQLGYRWPFTIYIGVIFLLTLFFNLATFRVHRDSPQLISVDSRTDSVPAAPQRISERDKDKPLIDRIHAIMEGERLYAEHGLTIGQLASRASLQEYRLRRLINQKLHYRNFNQYLNHYRIAEASRRLQDPQEAHLPISSIALDVGYTSLSSFNKAFKELHGVTPSSYRSRAQS